jgi:hypothetical protein
MNRALLAGLLACLLFPEEGNAGNLVEFPAGNAAWTVEIGYRNSPAASANPDSYAPRKALKVEVTQAEGVRRMLIKWSDGKVSERWAIANLPVVFEQDPRDLKVVVPVQAGSLGNQITEFEIPSGASSFAWLKPQLLANEKPMKYRDKDCLHYVGTIAAPAVSGEKAPPPVRAEAWIDSKTLLPVALDSELALCVFTFHERPPAVPLVIPPVFKQRIARYKEAAGIP